ncbi:MAG TPA: hypothetical protein VKT71_06865 [Candidatus Acidoferrales bacterium]|nr:hypothetical protein [Candidatus Acidoferrales bacterium]
MRSPVESGRLGPAKDPVMSGSDKTTGEFSRRWWPALGLALVLALYVFYVLRIRPANLFAVAQDDTIYFSSAKALAAGQGYVLPNLPGSPPATKYPILYPWILSWVWRWNPSFPANLSAALGITLISGVAYVILAFLFLRRLRGIGEWEALGLTAFCALNPAFLYFSSSVVSEVPFAALGLAAILVGNRGMNRESRPGWAVSSGILAGLTMLMRVLGIAFAAGLFCAALARRAWKQAAIVAACTVPALVMTALNAARRVAMPAGFDAAGPGFRSTWIYYMSYLGFRKLSMVSAHLIATMLASQVTYFFTELPAEFLSPLFHANLGLLLVGSIAVDWMVFAGLIRQMREDQPQPIHFALPFTVAAIFFWDFPEVRRFLIPFLPLLAAALWLEGKWIAGQLFAAMRTRKTRVERAFAAALLAALCAGGLGIAWNFAANKDRAELRRTSLNRGALLVEKREAYDWIRRNAPEGARAVAGEDGSFYLYTGRQAMAHIALQRAGAYDDAYLQNDLAHVTDVARAIGAQYWLASPDDSDKQWRAAKPPLAARYNEVEEVLPELFRSSGGQVRIYGLGCVQRPDMPECQVADRVLFPQGFGNSEH